VFEIQADPAPNWIPLPKNPIAQFEVFEIQTFVVPSLKNSALQVAQVVKSTLFKYWQFAIEAPHLVLSKVKVSPVLH
jgi:hypothetical protein